MCFPKKYVCTRYAQPCCKQLWKRHCQLPASILDCFYSGVWNKAAAKVLHQQVCIASRNLWIKLAPQTRRSRTAIISRLSLVFVTYDLVQDFPTMARVTSSKSLGPRQSAEGGPSQVAHRSKVGTWYWSHLVTFMDATRKGILYHLILLRQTFPIFSTSCTSSRCGKVGTAEGFRVAPSQLHEQRERFGCLQRFQVLTAVILRVTWLLKQQNTMSRWATFVSMIVNHCQ